MAQAGGLRPRHDGIRAVEAWAGDNYTARMKTFYAAHNEYLEQLLSTGLLGLAAWVAFIVSHLRRGFAHWKNSGVAPVMLALCSYLVQAIVSIRVSMIFPEVMLLFALLAAWTSPKAEQPAEPLPKGRGKRKAPRPAEEVSRWGWVQGGSGGQWSPWCWRRLFPI